MKLKFGILILILGQCFAAAAGVGAHGGNVVFCPGSTPVTLDYFNASLPTIGGPVSLADVTTLTQDQAYALVRSRFDGSGFIALFDQHAAALGPMTSWIAADLKSIDDSNEPYALPTGCTRQTGAARQGAAMYADPKVLAQMPDAQVGLLHAHEVLYEISGQDSSAPIRDLFRVILAQNFDPESLAKRMTAMNLPYAPWDFLRNGSWEPDGPQDWPRGKFTAKFDDPSSPTVLNYLEYDPARPGQYQASGRYVLDCSAKTQSCAMKNSPGGAGGTTDLHECAMALSSPANLTLTCFMGTSRVASYHFHRTGWSD